MPDLLQAIQRILQGNGARPDPLREQAMAITRASGDPRPSDQDIARVMRALRRPDAQRDLAMKTIHASGDPRPSDRDVQQLILQQSMPGLQKRRPY